MIRAVISAALIILLMISPVSSAADNFKETRKVSPFDEIKVFGRFEVVLVKGMEESVALESEKGRLDNVLTETEDNKLKIRMKVNYFQDAEVKVVVTYKALNEISAGAGARVDAGTIEGNGIVIKSNSGSDIKAEVIAERLETESTQGAGITLSGKVNTLDASVSTGGQLQAFPLIANDVKVKVSMGGYAKVTAKQRIDASVNMGGNITYKGMPAEVKRSSSMGGSITELRE